MNVEPSPNGAARAPGSGEGEAHRATVPSLYSLPDLGYDCNAFEPLLSAEVVELHYRCHHAAYVDGANEASAALTTARIAGRYDEIAELERNLAYNFSGHVLHSLLWRSLAPHGGGAPDGDLAEAVERAFGSFAALKAQLNSVCTSLQGSGWGALSWEPMARQLTIEQIFDHHNNVGRWSMPIIVIDMWEHAYYLQFRNRKDAWLDAFWQLVDWQEAARRFVTARQSGLYV
jgi:Fe-Mn family superoxide dismutase